MHYAKEAPKFIDIYLKNLWVRTTQSGFNSKQYIVIVTVSQQFCLKERGGVTQNETKKTHFKLSHGRRCHFEQQALRHIPYWQYRNKNATSYSYKHAMPILVMTIKKETVPKGEKRGIDFKVILELSVFVPDG